MSIALDGPYPDADELADHWWWRPGWNVGTRFYAWHLTIESQPDLQTLIAAYQNALQDQTTLDLIPKRWLHITMQGVGHVQDVPPSDRDAIQHAVTQRLATLPPARVTFHRPVLHREAVVIPPTDPTPLLDLRRAIRAGIEDVWGQDRVPEASDGFRPHVSAAYVNASAEPSPIRAALQGVHPAPVTATLRAASLIVMHRDHRMYEWSTVATAPIGPPSSDTAELTS